MTPRGSARPSPYAAIAGVLDRLAELLLETREDRGLTQQAAAEQIGTSKGTVGHIEVGGGCRVSSAVLVLRWLDARPQPVQTPVEDGVSAVNRTDTEEGRG